MAGDIPKVSLKASYRILKYAEGANPKVDTPFEVVEKEEIIEGEEALRLLEQLSGGEKICP